MRGMFRCGCIQLLNGCVVMTRFRLLHVRFEPAQRGLAMPLRAMAELGRIADMLRGISGMECQD